MKELDDLIEKINKRIPNTERSIREVEQMPCPDVLKKEYNLILEGYRETLIHDINMLKEANQMKGQMMAERFKKQTKQKIEMNNNLYGVSGGIKVGKDLIGEMIQYIANDSDPSFQGFEDSQNTIKSIYHKNHYEIKKCADKLKDCVCVILGCTRAQLEDRDYKEKELGEEWRVYPVFDEIYVSEEDANFDSDYDAWVAHCDDCGKPYNYILTPRLILQLLGTQGGRRVVHPNIWVNALFSDYKAIPDFEVKFGDSTTAHYPNWIITDVRFSQNEGKAISTRGGLLIGVKRLFALRFPEYAGITELNDSDTGYEIPRALSAVDPDLYKSLTHESETSMGDHSWCDVVIENNGTLEELFNNVLNAVQCQKELS